MAANDCTTMDGDKLVDEAWKNLFGPLAEVQSLISMYGTVPDHCMVSWGCLAEGAMSRLVDCIEAVETMQSRYGRKTLDQRMGLSGSPLPVDHPQ